MNELQDGHLIFSTEMPSQALSLKAAWIKCADQMPPLTGDLLAEYWVVNTDTLRVKLGLCEQEVGRAYYMQVNENSGRWVTQNCKPYMGNVTHYTPVIPPALPQD